MECVDIKCKTDICKAAHQTQDCGIQSVLVPPDNIYNVWQPALAAACTQGGETADQSSISIFHFYITHYYNISLKGQNYVL